MMKDRYWSVQRKFKEDFLMIGTAVSLYFQSLHNKVAHSLGKASVGKNAEVRILLVLPSTKCHWSGVRGKTTYRQEFDNNNKE